MKVLSIRKFTILLYLLLASKGIFSQQITVQAKKYKTNSIVRLAYQYGDRIYSKSSAQISKDKTAVFNLTDLHDGIYYVVFPDSSSFELMLEKDSVPLVIIDQENTKSYSIQGNKISENFNEYLIAQKTTLDKISALRIERRTHPPQSDSARLLSSKIDEFERGLDSVRDATIENNPESLLAAYLKAQKPIVIPEFNHDSNKIHKRIDYYTKNYLANVDLADPRLIYTPVYTSKINMYLDRIISQNTSTLTEAIDDILKSTIESEECTTFLADYLLLKYNSRLKDPLYEYLYVYLIESYYLGGKIPNIDENKLDKLRIEYYSRKSNLIGQPATDFFLQDVVGLNKSLHEIESEHLVLYFYQPECDACHRVTPELRKLSSRYNYLDLKVAAICLTDNHTEWKKTIDTYRLNTWINLFAGESIEELTAQFNLTTTPSIFILDKEKVIVNKNASLKYLDEYLLDVALKKKE